jgi:hypothetical protein
MPVNAPAAFVTPPSGFHNQETAKGGKPMLLRKISKLCASRELTWRYVSNFRPAINYRLNPVACPGESGRILRSLRRDGIATTTAAALPAAADAFQELRCHAFEVLRQKRNEIEAARAAALAPDPTGKAYTLEVLGPTPRMDPASPFARFALDHLLPIANNYFSMWTRLRQWNLWYTFPTQHPARASQLWHRDLDDLHLVLKVFIYLTDVDRGAGPFTYARGSQRTHCEPEYLFRDGHTGRADDRQMAAVIPPDRWLECTGEAGSMVFADTHGYHKGGLARTRDRIMYICMFTSPLAHSKDQFERPAVIPEMPKIRAQAFALAPPTRG